MKEAVDLKNICDAACTDARLADEQRFIQLQSRILGLRGEELEDTRVLLKNEKELASVIYKSISEPKIYLESIGCVFLSTDSLEQ